MRCVGWNTQSLAGAYYGLLAAEDGFDLASHERKGLLKFMSVERRPAAGRDVHVDETVVSIGIVPGKQDRVSVPDEPYVRQALIGVRSRDFESPLGIVGREGCSRLRSNRVLVHGIISCTGSEKWVPVLRKSRPKRNGFVKLYPATLSRSRLCRSIVNSHRRYSLTAGATAGTDLVWRQ